MAAPGDAGELGEPADKMLAHSIAWARRLVQKGGAASIRFVLGSVVEMRVRAALGGWIAATVLVCGLIVACAARKPPTEPTTPDGDASADDAAPSASAAPPSTAPSLYERLGKKDALAGVVEELMGNVLADNRIAKLFDKTRKDKTRTKQLSARMVAELCVVAGGGDDCGYDGKTMKDAHAGMNITGAQWDAFIEDLSIALKTRGVDDAAGKELVDKLAQQTKGDIVTPGKNK
jgi:hemoglobin